MKNQCNPHPEAPHGFDRNASHSKDRYVCTCEHWSPDDMAYRPGGLTQSEQMIDGLTEEETDATMSVRGLSQPQQEPVAWVRWDDEETYWDVRRNPPSDEAVQYLKSIKRPPWVPAYPHPLQREWRGLTDEEIEDACWTEVDQRLRSFASAIEQILRDKNA